MAKDSLKERLPKTAAVINDVLSFQVDYINVKNEQFDEDYNKLMMAIAAYQSSNEEEPPNGIAIKELLNSKLLASLDLKILDPKSKEAKENLNCEIVKELVKMYFSVIKNQMKDLILKIIVSILVNSYIGGLHEELINGLYKEENFEELFFEPDDLSFKRKAVAEMRKIIDKALKFVDETINKAKGIGELMN